MQHRKLKDIIAPSAQNNLFCVFLALILWYDIFLPQAGENMEGSISFIGNSPFSILIEELFLATSLQGRILNFLLYLCLCFVLLRLNEIFSFIRVRTILPSFFCLITGGLLLRPHIFSSGILVALLIIFAVFSSFKLISEGNPKYAFNTALLFSTAAFFSFSCIWFLFLFWIFTYVCNVLSSKVFLASLLGASVPILYTVIGFFWMGNQQILLDYLLQGTNLFITNFSFSFSELLYIGMVGILVLIASVNLLVSHSQENVKPRRELFYILSLFTLTLILIILSASDSLFLFWLLIVFGSILLGHFFSLVNNRFSHILLSIYCIGSILFFIYNI